MVVHGQRKIEIDHSVWFKGFDIWEDFYSFPSFLILFENRQIDRQTNSMQTDQVIRLQARESY